MVLPNQVFTILPCASTSKQAEKVSLSSFGLNEHSSLDIRSGSIGYTLSGKYTEVALS